MSAYGGVPGEVLTTEGSISLNEGAPRTSLRVVNSGDRPVQVGSHYHFAQANAALEFDRAAAHGKPVSYTHLTLPTILRV